MQKGGVVICPTDTVYGFLADASNKKAVTAIYKIKQRPTSKPLSVFVKDIKMAQELAEIDERQLKTLENYWPGKYTFVLKRKKGIKLYGLDKNTIAMRIPKYPFLNRLLKKMNRPLVQTSVNISGGHPINTISDIIKQFEDVNVLILDGGNLIKAKPSKIINLTNNEVIRK